VVQADEINARWLSFLNLIILHADAAACTKESQMLIRLTVGALIAGTLVAAIASLAAACKGSEVIFSDDFSSTDEAWVKPDPASGTMSIAGGKLTVTNKPSVIVDMIYDGDNFPGADLCVDIIMPTVKDLNSIEAGVLFTGSDSSYYVEFDGAGNGWASRAKDDNSTLELVKNHPIEGFNIEPKARNRLRVVWKGPQPESSDTPSDPKVSIYVNDKEFATFEAPPYKERQIGVTAGGSTGASFEFSNLRVANSPE
jgi:hypothetical protein